MQRVFSLCYEYLQCVSVFAACLYLFVLCVFAAHVLSN